MYKFRYQIKRLRNMAREWLRLTKLYVTKDERTGRTHLSHDWEINGVTGLFGRPHRYVTLTYETRDPSWHSDYVWRRTEDVLIPRDIFDQVMDTIRDIVVLYWVNIFIHETCGHPHHKVYIDWDGDDDVGYYKQLRCNACRGGHISEDDVDQFLPPDERHPELINGNRVNPMDRPGRARLYDDENDVFFADDYAQ